MKGYESYLASNVGWLVDIPKHWDCLKVGSLFFQRNTKVSDRDYAPLSVTKNGIVPQLATAAKSNDGDNRKLVCVGDFVINSRSDRKGSCGVSDFDGSVSLVNIVLEPRQKWNGRYVHYLLRSKPFSEEFYRWGRGIVADLWTTRYSEMKNILLPVPPRAEQDQIVRFLDWKVSKINKLILNNKKEIATLNEIKGKLIDDVTIAGLRKTEMTHNDTSWRIDFPSHWKLQRAGRSFTLRKGLSIAKENLEESGIAVINYGEVHSKKNSGVGLNDELIKYVNESYLNTNPSALVKKGDFIFADTSEDLDGCGNCAYVDWEGNVFAGYHSIIAHMDGTGDNKYFAYLFRAPRWRYQVRKRANRVKVYSITQYILKDVFILIPPEEEQVEIVRYLDGKCAKIDKMIANIERRINLLEGFKTSLISDVVTGQIDVRAVAIPEYERVEEIAEAESEDDEAELEEAGSEAS